MTIFLMLIILIGFIKAQINSTGYDATILSWIKSAGYGYNRILTNINKIEYSPNYVRIHTEGIPSYSMGPWNISSEAPMAQNLTFKIARNLNLQNSTTNKFKAAGKVGLLINGVSIYNSNDGQSYLNMG